MEAFTTDDRSANAVAISSFATNQDSRGSSVATCLLAVEA